MEQQPFDEDTERDEVRANVLARVGDLLDSWAIVAAEHANDGVHLQYQPYEQKQPRPLLREMLDRSAASGHAEKFRVNRSLRDVEPSVNLFLQDL